MTAVAEKIDAAMSALQDRQTAALGRFWEMARAAAGPGEIDPDDVIATCDAAGKTLDEFQAAAELVAQRTELRRAHDAHPELSRRTSEVVARRTALEKHVEEQVRVWRIELQDLRNEENQLIAADAVGRGAWTRLLHSCPYPMLSASRAATLAARLEVVQRIRWLGEQIRKVQDWVAQAEIDRKKQPVMGPGEGMNTRAMNDAEHWGHHLGPWQRELAEREAEHARMSAELAAIEEEMTRP